VSTLNKGEIMTKEYLGQADEIDHDEPGSLSGSVEVPEEKLESLHDGEKPFYAGGDGPTPDDSTDIFPPLTDAEAEINNLSRLSREELGQLAAGITLNPPENNPEIDNPKPSEP